MRHRGSRWLRSMICFLAVFLIFSGPALAEEFTQVNQDGFGSANNIEATTMSPFNGALFAGTTNAAVGAQVWSFIDKTWTQANTNGFGDPIKTLATASVVSGGVLYMAVCSGTGAYIYRYDDPGWTRVDNGFAGGSSSSLTSSIWAMADFNGTLYVGSDNSYDGAEVWRYDGGTSWTRVNKPGFGAPYNTSVGAIAVYKGHLYAAAFNDSDGVTVWRYVEGTFWDQVNDDGFGNYQNVTCWKMFVFNGMLFAGTENPDTGAEVWAYDGVTWARLNTDGFGDANNFLVGSFGAVDNTLYAGTGWVAPPTPGPPKAQDRGCQIFRFDGAAWIAVRLDGLGDENNTTAFSMATLDDRLYIGTMNEATGAEVWRMGTEPDPDPDDPDEKTKKKKRSDNETDPWQRILEGNCFIGSLLGD